MSPLLPRSTTSQFDYCQTALKEKTVSVSSCLFDDLKRKMLSCFSLDVSQPLKQSLTTCNLCIFSRNFTAYTAYPIGIRYVFDVNKRRIIFLLDLKCTFVILTRRLYSVRIHRTALQDVGKDELLC